MSTLIVTVSLFLIIVDFSFGIASLLRKNIIGRSLGMACFFAGLVGLFYLGSVSTGGSHYTLMSVLSSSYFLCIDCMLICLIFYSKAFGKTPFTRLEQIVLCLFILYFGFEVVFFIWNIFYEVVVGYEYAPNILSEYTYVMKPLYIVHLVYTYGMVVFAVYLMLKRAFQLPKEYRPPYYFFPGVIGMIILVNAIFLFNPNQGIFSELDISIWLYSIAIIFLFWHSFYYSKTRMLNHFKSALFDSLNQGVMMFDYDNELILYNDPSADLFPSATVMHGMSLQEFLKQTGINFDINTADVNQSFTCYTTQNGMTIPLRCDYKRLTSSNGVVLVGKLFVFTNLAGRLDLLTGFLNYEAFLRHKDEADVFPNMVLVADISGLTQINSSYGHTEGDRLLRMLASLLKSSFPEKSVFVRSREADLIVLCYESNESRLHEIMSRVTSDFPEKLQYGMAPVVNDDVEEAIHTAQRALTNRKLMDVLSPRSSTLSSLVRALKECDPDTEAHVKRTQAMGDALANRLGLMDLHKSQLALLCLLHDIGKIGVPLDILNKPGRLTDEEFTIIRSHVEKGYNIAVSSPEFSGIADMVRFHHERWDGKGYPDGLSGEEIPLLSRIISIVDAFDAMVSVRSYKPAMTREAALNEIENCAGTQFDPVIAKEFHSLMNENPELGLILDTPINGQSETVIFPQTAPSRGFTSHEKASPLSTTLLPYSTYTLDSRFRIVSVDKAFEQITGYSAEEVSKLQLSQTDLIPETERAEYLQLLNEQIAREKKGLFRHSIKRKDGTILKVYCFGRLYYDSATRSERSEIIISTTTSLGSVDTMSENERIHLMHQLRYWDQKVRRDPRNGMLTPKAFRNEVEVQSILEESPTLLILARLVSGTLSSVSPREIQRIDQLFQGELRKNDLSTYLGDDLFAAAVLFEKNDTPEVIARRAREIQDNLKNALAEHSREWIVDFGYAVSTPSCNHVDQLIRKARKMIDDN